VFFCAWFFSPKQKKNEQHTTDNEIKLHETKRKMNSTNKTDNFSLSAFTAEREAVECKDKHKHQSERRES
jgi:hypothetical protein